MNYEYPKMLYPRSPGKIIVSIISRYKNSEGQECCRISFTQPAQLDKTVPPDLFELRVRLNPEAKWHPVIQAKAGDEAQHRVCDDIPYTETLRFASVLVSENNISRAPVVAELRDQTRPAPRLDTMKTIHEFRILHDGWEMDNAGRVVERGVGIFEIWTTNHGAQCLMSQRELAEKIAETEQSLAGLKRAQELTG